MKLEVKNIHKSFGGTEVLHGISFTVESNNALGLLGRNGAGKTTTMRILMDVFKANEGEILLDGKKFEPSKCSIGYMPEERGLYPKRVILEQMVYFGRLHGMKKKDAQESSKKWLERMGIGEYANRKLETLSKGNQQKVQLATTLVANPDIVVLDEPFSGLDPVNSQVLKEIVTELITQGKLVIFSSHQMNYVEEFCDNIVIINHGNVVLSGQLKDIKKEFGKNQLVVAFEDTSMEETKRILEKRYADYVQVTAVTKNQVVLRLKDDVEKNDFIQAMTAKEEKIAFVGNYEPSLNDIFVEKAGDES